MAFSPIRIACWRLDSIAQEEELSAVLEVLQNFSIEILCLSVDKWSQMPRLVADNGVHFLFSRPSTETSVALVMTNKLFSAMLGYECVSNKIMVAHFAGETPCSVVACSAPGPYTTPSEIHTFYRELTKVTQSIGEEGICIIAGNFNSQVGHDAVAFAPAIGPYGPSDYSATGQHLVYWCLHLGFVALNTLVQSDDFTTVTYQARDGSPATVTDYLLVKSPYQWNELADSYHLQLNPTTRLSSEYKIMWSDFYVSLFFGGMGMIPEWNGFGPPGMFVDAIDPFRADFTVDDSELPEEEEVECDEHTKLPLNNRQISFTKNDLKRFRDLRMNFEQSPTVREGVRDWLELIGGPKSYWRDVLRDLTLPLKHFCPFDLGDSAPQQQKVIQARSIPPDKGDAPFSNREKSLMTWYKIDFSDNATIEQRKECRRLLNAARGLIPFDDSTSLSEAELNFDIAHWDKILAKKATTAVAWLENTVRSSVSKAEADGNILNLLENWPIDHTTGRYKAPQTQDGDPGLSDGDILLCVYRNLRRTLMINLNCKEAVSRMIHKFESDLPFNGLLAILSYKAVKSQFEDEPNSTRDEGIVKAFDLMTLVSSAEDLVRCDVCFRFSASDSASLIVRVATAFGSEPTEAKNLAAYKTLLMLMNPFLDIATHPVSNDKFLLSLAQDPSVIVRDQGQSLPKDFLLSTVPDSAHPIINTTKAVRLSVLSQGISLVIKFGERVAESVAPLAAAWIDANTGERIITIPDSKDFPDLSRENNSMDDFNHDSTAFPPPPIQLTGMNIAGSVEFNCSQQRPTFSSDAVDLFLNLELFLRCSPPENAPDAVRLDWLYAAAYQCLLSRYPHVITITDAPEYIDLVNKARCNEVYGLGSYKTYELNYSVDNQTIRWPDSADIPSIRSDYAVLPTDHTRFAVPFAKAHPRAFKPDSNQFCVIRPSEVTN